MEYIKLTYRCLGSLIVVLYAFTIAYPEYLQHVTAVSIILMTIYCVCSFLTLVVPEKKPSHAQFHLVMANEVIISFRTEKDMAEHIFKLVRSNERHLLKAIFIGRNMGFEFIDERDEAVKFPPQV